MNEQQLTIKDSKEFLRNSKNYKTLGIYTIYVDTYYAIFFR